MKVWKQGSNYLLYYIIERKTFEKAERTEKRKKT